MSLADLRAHLLRARAELDQAIAALPLEDGPAPATYATVAGFALRQGVSGSTVRSWVRAGLPCTKIGRVVRIPIQQAEAWCSSGGANAAVRRLASVDAHRGAA